MHNPSVLDLSTSSPRRAGNNGNGLDRTHSTAGTSVIVNQSGPVTLVQLNRPGKRNALNGDIIDDLSAVFSRPPQGTKVIIVHGAGDHFCAGADLSLISETPQGIDAIRLSRAMHRALDHIEYGDVPVIAVLHGAVIGGGLELAAAAHIRVAERNAYYGLPEGTRGIFVGGSGAVRIPRLIGTSRMTDMMLTGRTYSAEQGASLGLSQYVVAEGQGLAKAIELAERIATNATLSNFAIVQALPRIARSEPDAGLFMESLMISLTASDAEAKTRILDFLQKRAAKISHRPEEKTTMHFIPFDTGE